MISVLFNLLCIGTFASFGLTCALIHKLCSKRCARRYTAIESGSCYCEKYIASNKIASIYSTSSNSTKKNSNRKKCESNEISCCKYKATSNISTVSENTSSCSQNTSSCSQNTSSCSQNNSNFKRNNCSCTTKKKKTSNSPISITLPYDSNIFKRFTIESTNSCLASNINISIHSDSTVSSIEQNELSNIQTTPKNSYKNSSIGSEICYEKSMDSANSNLNTNTCGPENNDESSNESDEIYINFIDLDLCCILKPNSKCKQSSVSCIFSDNSSSVVINYKKHINPSYNRNVTNDEKCITKCGKIVQNDNKTDISSDDSKMFSFMDITSDQSDDISKFVASCKINSMYSSVNQSMDTKSSIKLNESQEYNTEVTNDTENNRKYNMVLEQSRSTSSISNTCTTGTCSDERQTNDYQTCDCPKKVINLNHRQSHSETSVSKSCSSQSITRQSNSQVSYNISPILYDTVCQKEYCKNCSCSQTPCSNKSQKTTSCISDEETCQKACCIKYNCSNTIASRIYKKISNGINEFLCKINGKCKNKCCVKCNCTGTIKCHEKKCDECQTKNCTKSNCTQTICSINNETQGANSHVCNSACQTECCRKNLCNHGCQTDCCTKFNCIEIMNSKKFQAESNGAQTRNKEITCKSNCCTNSICTQTALITNTNICKNCSNICCSKCVFSSGCIKKESKTKLAENSTQCKLILKKCLKPTSFDRPKFESCSRSSTTMILKRKRIKSDCCPLALFKNDTVLIEGNIQIKQIAHEPLKYVFKTQESDNTIRIHELCLHLKNQGCSIEEKSSIEKKLSKCLLKLKVSN